MTDKTTAEREAFEAWMNQQDQADPEPERTYKLDEDGMNQLTKDCMLVAWQARASLPLPGAQEAVARSAVERDELLQAALNFIRTLTGMEPPPIEVAPPEVFAPFRAFVDTVQAITARFAAPQSALSAGWVSVKDRLPPPFDEVWVHPRPSDYCCEASVDTVGNWKYSEYETNFGVNHIKCTVEYWMQPPALPVEPSMDGESRGTQ